MSMDATELGVVIFSVGSYVFGTKVSHIISVVKSPDKIRQIGASVPLFSLYQYMDTATMTSPEPVFIEDPTGYDGEQVAILVDTASGIMGVLVKSVNGTADIPLEKIEPLPDFVRNRVRTSCIWGIGRLGEELLILLDLDRYLLHIAERTAEAVNI